MMVMNFLKNYWLVNLRMRRLEISHQTEVELIQIMEYTTIKWGKKQSNKYLVDLHNTMVLLIENPHIGVNRPELSSEIYSFPHTSHMIYYKFDIKILTILAVLHKSMLPKEQLQGR